MVDRLLLAVIFSSGMTYGTIVVMKSFNFDLLSLDFASYGCIAVLSFVIWVLLKIIFGVIGNEVKKKERKKLPVETIGLNGEEEIERNVSGMVLPPLPPGDVDSGEEEILPPPPPPPSLRLVMTGEEEEEGEEEDEFLSNLPKPSVEMKNVSFHRIKKLEMKSSMWMKEDLYNTKNVIKIEEKELEELFERKKEKIEEEEKNVVEASYHHIILDKSNLVDVFRLLLPISVPDLVRLIKDGDIEGDLDPYILENLNDLVTALSEENLMELEKYEGDLKLLSPPDFFIRELMIQIPRLKSRVQCMMTLRNFEVLEKKVVTLLDNNNKALKSLMTSKNWKRILQVILSIGNFMNGKNKKKIVRGYSMMTLESLSRVRSSKFKDMNLLRYVVQFVSHRYPEFNKFLEEVDVKNLTDFGGDCVDRVIKKLKRKVELMDGELEYMNDKTVFYGLVKEFVEKKKEVLETTIMEMKKEEELLLGEIADNYGMSDKDGFVEDPSKFAIFRYVVSFFDEYKRELDSVSRK